MNAQPETLSWQIHNIEAEQALIGAIFINNASYHLAAKFITAEHFYEPIHQTIYGVIESLLDAGRIADPRIVQCFIPNAIVAPNITLRQYLARLAAEATTIINAPDYARIIRELADRRKLAEIAYGLMPADASHPTSLATEAISALDEVVASSFDNSSPTVSVGQAIDMALDEAARAYENNGKFDGLPTTLKDLDAKLGGLAGGDLIVLAGRPGMGKSAVITTMLRRQAMLGYKSMFSSLEMSAGQIGGRVLSDAMYDSNQSARLPYSNMRRGQFHERLFDNMRDCAIETKRLIADSIHIDPQSRLTLSQISTRARQRKRRHGLDLLAVDHLDLVQPSSRYKGNKVYELGEITAGLKALAKELGIPVVLLCQLSRDVEKRDDKRPILADLRSSGSIEQDADTVIFLYRKSYYLQNAEPIIGTPEHELWQNDVEKNLNLLTAIVAKQRSGPTGSVELFCDIGNNAVRDISHDVFPGAR